MVIVVRGRETLAQHGWTRTQQVANLDSRLRGNDERTLFVVLTEL
jgi:hypothetical protein